MKSTEDGEQRAVQPLACNHAHTHTYTYTYTHIHIHIHIHTHTQAGMSIGATVGEALLGKEGYCELSQMSKRQVRLQSDNTTAPLFEFTFSRSSTHPPPQLILLLLFLLNSSSPSSSSFVPIAALVPGDECRLGGSVCTHDLERLDGGHGKREPNRRCSQVTAQTTATRPAPQKKQHSHRLLQPHPRPLTPLIFSFVFIALLSL